MVHYYYYYIIIIIIKAMCSAQARPKATSQQWKLSTVQMSTDYVSQLNRNVLSCVLKVSEWKHRLIATQYC